MRKRDPSSISLIGRLSYLLRPIPVTREQLFDVLARARKRNLLDENALPMIQRVIKVSESQVAQVMVARAQMVTIDSSNSFELACLSRSWIMPAPASKVASMVLIRPNGLESIGSVMTMSRRSSGSDLLAMAT